MNVKGLICDNAAKVRLQKLAQNITTSYDYVESNGMVTFDITFNNLSNELYLVDVWEMSNVFRIISFIVLGILILFTSFMYQKLKNLMKNLMEKPNDNTGAEQ